MSRNYGDVKKHEREMIEEINQGKTLREVGEKYGYTYKQMRDFKTRYNRKQKKVAAGIAIKKAGGQPKNDAIKKQYRIAELEYMLELKDDEIKRLEMENELMRDFLSLTERK